MNKYSKYILSLAVSISFLNFDNAYATKIKKECSDGHGVPGLSLISHWHNVNKQLNCNELRSMKASLDSIKTRKDFNSSNKKVAYALESLTDLFEDVLNAKTVKESNQLVSQISSCMAKDIPAHRLNEARKYVNDVKNKDVEFEKEKFSILELACTGFTIKEILAFATGKAAASSAAGAAGSTAGAATVGTAAATATAVTAAAVGGWLIGEGLMALDTQTGNHFQKPFNKYIITPIVYKWVGVPSDKERIRTEAKLLSTRFLITYQESKFGKPKK